jgi:Skp family chaperone for outer membrane proteins
MRQRLARYVLCVCLAFPAIGIAQDAPKFVSPILTVDQDRLFTGSKFGQGALARIEAASRALAAENREIEARLTEEERVLTQRRPTLPLAEFRKLADDFDARVEEIRKTQDGKARGLGRMHDEEKQKFLTAAVPVLGELVRAMGAVAILDRSAIVLTFERIDITDEAIARLDETLGDGTGDAPEDGTSPRSP